MLKKLFLVLKTIFFIQINASDAIAHVHIANKLMEAIKWSIFVKTAKKAVFLLGKFAKAVNSKIACSATKKETAKSASSIITLQLYRIPHKNV